MEMTREVRRCVRVLAARHRAGEKPFATHEADAMGKAMGISSRNAALIVHDLLEEEYLRVVAELTGRFNLVVQDSLLELDERLNCGFFRRLARLFCRR